jgi:multiple sugar transport system permease protein
MADLLGEATAVATTPLVLALGTYAGYALTRLPMRGKTAIMTVLLTISLFPTIALLVLVFRRAVVSGLTAGAVKG